MDDFSVKKKIPEVKNLVFCCTPIHGIFHPDASGGELRDRCACVGGGG